MSLEISSVTGSESIGGITQPIIGQRRIDHETRLMDGEVEDSETQSMSGYPWVSRLPILKYLFAQDNRERREDEIVFAITPHILRAKDVTEENLRAIDVGTGSSTELRRKAPPKQQAATQPPAPATPASASRPAAAAPASPHTPDTTTPAGPAAGPRPMMATPATSQTPGAASPAGPGRHSRARGNSSQSADTRRRHSAGACQRSPARSGNSSRIAEPKRRPRECERTQVPGKR
jgi:general secretion pathway protein D